MAIKREIYGPLQKKVSFFRVHVLLSTKEEFTQVYCGAKKKVDSISREDLTDSILKHKHAKGARVIFLVIGVFVELCTVMIWLSVLGLRCTARRKLEIYNLQIQRFNGNGKIAK